MNINRFIWTTTAVLFALLGGFAGWVLGNNYAKNFVGVGYSSGSMQTTIVWTLTLGLVVVLARVGLWIATRWMLPALTQLRRVSAVDRVLSIAGAMLGLVFGILVSYPLSNLNANNKFALVPVQLCIMAVCAGIGMAMLQGMRTEMLRAVPALSDEVLRQESPSQPKILDTNVIIDGRIADLCRTGFIEGPLYLPHIVLQEAQYIADSADDLRRARGRRGLEVLSQLREMTVTRPGPKLPSGEPGTPFEEPLVRMINELPLSVRGQETVDSKLVFLAKEMGASIITNDFNLNRVAGVQGVRVLNINELTQALKPVVLPGEEMTVSLVKEGKEVGQGVGYLDDGTMIVVSDGADHVGETRVVVISSVYQTLAGKMIFADLKDKGTRDRPMRGPGDDLFDEGNNGSHSRSQHGHDDLGHRASSGVRRKSQPRR